jgi:photosystem II stability/assembly factor-like uncharacterized protein
MRRILVGLVVLLLVAGCGGTKHLQHLLKNGPKTTYSYPAGVDSGLIEALAVDPHHPQTVYAHQMVGSLFKSTDSGARWRSVEPARWSINGFALDPRRPATVYAEGSDPLSREHVIKSTDGGLSWRKLGHEGQFASAFAVAASGRVLYLGTVQSGVFASRDGGRSWRSVGLRGTPLIDALAVDPQNPQIVYAIQNAAIGGPVFESRNGGTTWRQEDFGGGTAFKSGVLVVAPDPRHPRVVYAGAIGGVFKSTNGGASWRPAGLGREGFIEQFAFDPRNARVVYTASPTGVFKSADGGRSWRPVSFEGKPAGDRIQALTISPNGRILYIGTGAGGVFALRFGR